ncbi:MSMEG_6728 family protein [Microbacterium sp. ET2]|uniref:MSMEG_6728 family protein n=1 Tax=Microbacterium albipurpureum TaxID=3050384 RepID=UPI00259C74CB|nr:MSMEG_6728 family protein [Microbacterium sp. ET2 (Ac-2212)]WJL95780.1 MSMEG_6728 family protein [Microbacterium sp. ET2 (Ac-2212)]
MQTFLPYPAFAESARVLDRRRLGKQRVETLQLLRAVTIPDYGWRNHPAARMWRDHLPALVAYGLVIADTWIADGGSDTVRPLVLAFAPEVEGLAQDAVPMPPWLGDEAFHLAHRSNLIRKDPEHYRPFFGDVPDDLPYIWPG